jgi:hypothetical protein
MTYAIFKLLTLSVLMKASEPELKRARTTDDYELANILVDMSERGSLWTLDSLLARKDTIEQKLGEDSQTNVMISPDTLEIVPDDNNSPQSYVYFKGPLKGGLHTGWFSVWLHQRASSVGLSPSVESLGFGVLNMSPVMKVGLTTSAPPFIQINKRIADDVQRTKAAFEFGIRLIRSLEELHTRAKIVHGMLTPEALLSQDGKILFQYFSRACFTDISFEGFDRFSNRPDSTHTRYSSIHEIERMRLGQCPTVQGDLYSAVSLVARLASLEDESSFFKSYEMARAEEWEGLHRFVLPQGLQKSTFSLIGEYWRSVVRSVHAPTPPTYKFLIESFEEIIKRLRNVNSQKRVEWSVTNPDHLVHLCQEYLRQVQSRDAEYDASAYLPMRTGYETLPNGRLFLGNLIGTPRNESVAYSVSNRDDLMITYYLEVGRHSQMRGSLREMFFSRTDFFKGMMPRMLFMSPAGSLTRGAHWDDTQAAFKLSASEFEALRSQETFVRYIVSTRVDKSMFDSPAEPKEVIDAILLLVDLIREVDCTKQGCVLHFKRSEIGIGVHDAKPKIVLTNIVRSVNLPNAPRVQEPSIEDLELLGPWRNRNEPYGQRDELYQILQLLHILMHDPERLNQQFQTDLIRIHENKDQWMTGTLELSTDALDRPVQGLNSHWEPHGAAVDPIIEQLWGYLRSIPDHTAKVDYDLVTKLLMHIKEVV